ncbi:hypothetical protein AVEN_222712-1 [Araneus ventricosus]|uniref:Uncharacterized protein n=1 Tax=Araneus ventricosus TaxID=182803 RepID=A0A4Y2B1S8_ARAVE|nr:hypothetical protein AVEN_222712-1 [Araneus ventricosus]
MSVRLTEFLLCHETTVSGTIRANSGFPKELLVIPSPKKQSAFVRSGIMLHVKPLQCILPLELSEIDSLTQHEKKDFVKESFCSDAFSVVTICKLKRCVRTTDKLDLLNQTMHIFLILATTQSMGRMQDVRKRSVYMVYSRNGRSFHSKLFIIKRDIEILSSDDGMEDGSTSSEFINEDE